MDSATKQSGRSSIPKAEADNSQNLFICTSRPALVIFPSVWPSATSPL